MSISLWILIRPETRGVVLSAGDQSWPVEGSRKKEGRGREGREEGEGREGEEKENKGRRLHDIACNTCTITIRTTYYTCIL